MTAAVPLIRRRDAMRLHVAFAVSAAGLLAGCDSPPPPVDYPPLRYDYLPKLRLNVASIDIDNACMSKRWRRPIRSMRSSAWRKTGCCQSAATAMRC